MYLLSCLVSFSLSLCWSVGGWCADVELVVNATVDNVCKKTQKHASSNKPHWNEDLQLYVKLLFNIIMLKATNISVIANVPLMEDLVA